MTVQTESAEFSWDDSEDDEWVQESDPNKRKKKAYRPATVRPQTRLEAFANADDDDLFGEVMDDLLPSLRELYVDMNTIRNELEGSNGYRVIGSFSGCGGSRTGFSWSGWEDLLTIEFVKSARETMAANYETVPIEPERVMEAVEEWMEQDESDLKVQFNRATRSRGSTIPRSINWEATLEEAARSGDPVKMEAVDNLRYTATLTTLKEASEKGRGLLWGDDVRGIHPQAILDALGLKPGELDCWEGSPPCKSFSPSGLREDGWGKVLHYSDERHQRTDDLFMEYLRILSVLMPKSFIAENVAGLEMGNAGSQVLRPLLKAFSDLGYTVEAKLLNAQDYGVPQSRPRVFIQGIRKDIVDPDTGAPMYPSWPTQFPGRYTVADALEAAGESIPSEIASSWLGSRNALEERIGGTVPPGTSWDNAKGKKTEGMESSPPLDPADIRYETGRIWESLGIGSSPENKAYQMIRCHPNLPSPTITATSAGNVPAAGPTHPHECRKFTINEYRWLFSFPHDYVFTGSPEQQGERMGRSVCPHLMKGIADAIKETLDRGVLTSQED